MADPRKAPSLCFLSIPSDTLLQVWRGTTETRSPSTDTPWGYSEHKASPGRRGTSFYSTLGARIIAGSDVSAEIGELWPGSPYDRRPPVMGVRACWERQITWVRCESWKGVQGRSGFKFLDDLNANPQGYEHFTPTEPPTWKRGKITQYFYNPIETAIHMAGPVDLFEPLPEKQVSDRDLLFGHQPSQMKPQPSHMKPQPSEIRPVGPLSVWEPHLDGVQVGSDTLAKVKSICKKFDVVACTHIDLENVFPDSEENKGGFHQFLLENIRSKKGRSKSSIESHARRLLMSGVGRRNEGTVVARSGELGCLVATRLPRNKNKVKFDWLPSSYDDIFRYMAYMENPNSQDYKVVHIGTLFVGALTYAMAKGASAVEGAKQAAVASTCLMQLEKHRFELLWSEYINIPPEAWWTISTTMSVTAHDLQPFHRDGKDYWLGTEFADRLKLFQTTPSDPYNPRGFFSRLATLPKTQPRSANAKA